MASGFFTILDDIAAIMDDVAVMSKIATQKTAGILGDDLAVNAEKASGFHSTREIPVLWTIAKGSFVNKLIILPIAFLLSAFFPLFIIFILVLGGLFLAYEGAEKIFDYAFPHHAKENKKNTKTISETENLNLEKEKIKSAIFTDFILSIEIIIIALGTVIEKPIVVQIIVVSIIAILATVGVYGIVGFIVRMDEIGYKLISMNAKPQSFSKKIGNILVHALPMVIKSLSVIGTLALVVVAGGIFVHSIAFFHSMLPHVPSFIKEFGIGLAIGFLVLGIVTFCKKRFIKNPI